jgi:hypothetical protein
METKSPREIKLAKEQLMILIESIDRNDTDLEFLEVHARALLHHIQNARYSTDELEANEDSCRSLK